MSFSLEEAVALTQTWGRRKERTMGVGGQQSPQPSMLWPSTYLLAQGSQVQSPPHTPPKGIKCKAPPNDCIWLTIQDRSGMVLSSVFSPGYPTQMQRNVDSKNSIPQHGSQSTVRVSPGVTCAFWCTFWSRSKRHPGMAQTPSLCHLCLHSMFVYYFKYLYRAHREPQSEYFTNTNSFNMTTI